MAFARSALILSLTALSLSACAAEKGAYPSLARRPAERVTGTVPVASPTPEAPAPADPATLGKLDSLVTQARAADTAFRAQEGRTRAAVSAASGSAPGSEAWSVATVALSQLETSRSQGMLAMAELERLYTDAVLAGQSAGEIAAARNTVQGLLGAQSATIDSLKASLR